MKIAIGTRFYEEDRERLTQLETFVKKAAELVDEVFVVINVVKDKTKAFFYLKKLKIPKLHLLGMNAWGKFTPALNAIVYHTSKEGFTHLLLCSPEVHISSSLISELASYVDDSTLVAGAAMAGHEFSEGEVAGNGANVPWNTLAVWNLKYLSRIGFVMSADAPFDEASAGVEELSTCAVLQKLYPQLKVKLVKLGDVKWDVGSLDEERIAAHIKKIDSKKERAQKQMDNLQLPPPKILHIS